MNSCHMEGFYRQGGKKEKSPKKEKNSNTIKKTGKNDKMIVDRSVERIFKKFLSPGTGLE